MHQSIGQWIREGTLCTQVGKERKGMAMAPMPLGLETYPIAITITRQPCLPAASAALGSAAARCSIRKGGEI